MNSTDFIATIVAIIIGIIFLLCVSTTADTQVEQAINTSCILLTITGIISCIFFLFNSEGN